MRIVFGVSRFSCYVMMFCILFSSLLSLTCIADIKEEKKHDPEERAEMSRNAQFRAIQPSSSILSYVEDNVICMHPSDIRLSLSINYVS